MRSLGKAKDPPSSRWMRRGESGDGPLTRTTARRAGSFWEKKEGTVKVFVEKGERTDAEAEKRTERGIKFLD